MLKLKKLFHKIFHICNYLLEFVDFQEYYFFSILKTEMSKNTNCITHCLSVFLKTLHSKLLFVFHINLKKYSLLKIFLIVILYN